MKTNRNKRAVIRNGGEVNQNIQIFSYISVFFLLSSKSGHMVFCQQSVESCQFLTQKVVRFVEMNLWFPVISGTMYTYINKSMAGNNITETTAKQYLLILAFSIENTSVEKFSQEDWVGFE